MRSIIELSNGKTIVLIDGKTKDGYTEDEAIDNALNSKKNVKMSMPLFTSIIGGFSGLAIALLPYYIRKIPK